MIIPNQWENKNGNQTTNQYGHMMGMWVVYCKLLGPILRASAVAQENEPLKVAKLLLGHSKSETSL